MIRVMKQFSVFLPNKPGELRKLLLKVRKMNLTAAATFASRDGAIMRLVPQDKGSFENVLKHERVSYSKEDVVMASIEDEPGGLLRVLTTLQQAHVNIEGLYIVGGHENGKTHCMIQADDVERAVGALSGGKR
ncbi:MAG: hypothetical protein C4523_03685 [Myxococcales bacterium]|nr:MAG: hypothetical protein C4523_03685 [Myxococcales bacterium]